MSVEHNNHNRSVSLMRVIAIVAVVLIHTTTRILESVKYDFGLAPLAIIFNQLARFAVPLFFMISGFVLELNYKEGESYRNYLQRRVGKIIIPYLVWSGIYYFFVYKTHTISYWVSLIGGNASYQLYFIPTLIIFYAIFPVLHRNLRWISNRWTMLLLGLVQAGILYVDYNVQPIDLPYPILIGVFNYYIFICGAAFSHHQQKIETLIRRYSGLTYVATFILGTIVTGEGIFNYQITRNYLAFYSQWRPSVMIYTLFVASTMYYVFSKIEISPKVINKFASLSLFVYFAHVLVLELVWRFLPPGILFISTILLSFGLAFGVSRFSKLAKLLG